MNEMNDDRGRELDELRTKLMKENHFLKSLASKPLSVYFDAFRTKAYDGGGEENLTFQVSGSAQGKGHYIDYPGLMWKMIRKQCGYLLIKGLTFIDVLLQVKVNCSTSPTFNHIDTKCNKRWLVKRLLSTTVYSVHLRLVVITS